MRDLQIHELIWSDTSGPTLSAVSPHVLTNWNRTSDVSLLFFLMAIRWSARVFRRGRKTCSLADGPCRVSGPIPPWAINGRQIAASTNVPKKRLADPAVQKVCQCSTKLHSAFYETADPNEMTVHLKEHRVELARHLISSFGTDLVADVEMKKEGSPVATFGAAISLGDTSPDLTRLLEKLKKRPATDNLQRGSRWFSFIVHRQTRREGGGWATRGNIPVPVARRNGKNYCNVLGARSRMVNGLARPR